MKTIKINHTYENGKTVSYEVKKMKYSDYKNIKNEYPSIYLGDGMETFVSEIQGFIFFPDFYNADNEESYIEKMSDEEYVDVIISKTENVLSDFFYKNFKNDLLKKENIFKTYIMYDSNTDLYKIGKSKDPKFREGTLQSKKPTIDLILVCDKYIEIELHDKFSSKRGRGEWFSLNSDNILDVIEEYGFYKSKNV